MSDVPQILLNHRLRSLRLPTVLREYGNIRVVYNTRGHRGRLNGTMQRLSEERAGRV